MVLRAVTQQLIHSLVVTIVDVFLGRCWMERVVGDVFRVGRRHNLLWQRLRFGSWLGNSHRRLGNSASAPHDKADE